MDNSSLNNPVKARLLESYVNGFHWYRIYADGYVEQGGKMSSGKGSRSDNYPIILNSVNSIELGRTMSGAADSYADAIISYSTSSLTIYQAHDWNQGSFWIVRGYK